MVDPGQVRGILISAARQRVALTDAELLGVHGHTFTRPLMRQADGLPGQGWCVPRVGLCDDLPREWERFEARRYTEARQAEAFDYWDTHDRS